MRPLNNVLAAGVFINAATSVIIINMPHSTTAVRAAMRLKFFIILLITVKVFCVFRIIYLFQFIITYFNKKN